ncbi:hypothetical protein [Kordiimonas aquimaris]|uniref:hypothetical protein n=1 Tax=Kordiimonas aquimaris TaxID=707591 RepID=UPI0021D34455|nr:hypothetical protein [Kordiimonas aquimaris]
MRRSLKHIVDSFIVGTGLLFGITASVNAQAIFTGALNADAGSYPPIVLGEGVNLDGCGSTFDVGGSAIANLCDAPTISDVSFTWFIQNDATSAFTVLTGAVLSLTSGGVGDFFNAVGTYTVNLNIGATTPFFDLGGGFGFRDISLASGDTGRIFGSSFDNDSTAFTVTTVSVPEPESLLLLVPALLMIGRRQRRLIKSNKSA